MTAPEAPVGRLFVCPTPIGNLEDVTLRVLSVARQRRRDRLRGHPPHPAPARAPRHQRAPARAARAQRTRAGAGARRPRRGRGRASRSSPTPARRSSPTPASRSCANASPPACRSRCCRARPRRSPPSIASGLPVDSWRFVGFLPRARAELAELLVRRPGDARRVRVAAAAARDARADRRRGTRAPAGRLPRADQDPRGSPPRQRPRAGRALPGRRRPGERSCSSAAPRRRGAPAARRRWPAARAGRRRREAEGGRRRRRAAHRPVAPTSSTGLSWPTSSLGAGDVLLRHHADLLRQRRAASRARLHDDRGRRAWPATTASAARTSSS